MPYLGDYLGQLLSEITIARMHADLEAVRLAELYASHPLLRTMPIPHFRLPDVELEVPVVIKQMDEPRAGESTRGGVDPKTLRKAFDTTLALQLRKSQIKLSAEQSKSVQALIDAAASDEDLPHEIAVDTHRVADRFAETVSKVLAATVPPEDPERLEQIRKLTAELKTSVRLAFLKTRVPPPRLSTLVTTQDIREAGSDENVTRLKLKITEESVEWTMVESDGQMQGRLVPE
jgi:hypothetical protein